MSKQNVAIILNIIVVVLTILGSIMCFGEIYFAQTKVVAHGIVNLKFFTVQSNILGGLTALLYVIYAIISKRTGKAIPKVVHILRFVACIDLVITFLVVALFLGFITDEGYLSMYVNANLLFHLLIPVLTFVSFVFLEEKNVLTIKHTFWGVLHLVLYSIFYLVVVLTHFNGGTIDLKYDWYAFAQRGLLIAFVCAFVVLSLGYFVSWLLYKLNKQKKD